MYRHILAYTLVLTSVTCARAQSGFNMRAGIGTVTNQGNSAEPAPDVEISYSRLLSKNIGLGASLGYQKYVFNISDIGDYSSAPQTIIQLKQKSEYIFISPTVNARLGRRINLIAGIGAGVLCSARQNIIYLRKITYWTSSMHPYPSTYILPYEAKTSDNVNKLILRVQACITERISGEDARANVFLFQTFSYTPTNLSENKDPGIGYTNEKELKLKAYFLSLGLGFSINYTKAGKVAKSQ